MLGSIDVLLIILYFNILELEMAEHINYNSVCYTEGGVAKLRYTNDETRYYIFY